VPKWQPFAKKETTIKPSSADQDGRNNHSLFLLKSSPKHERVTWKTKHGKQNMENKTWKTKWIVDCSWINPPRNRPPLTTFIEQYREEGT